METIVSLNLGNDLHIRDEGNGGIELKVTNPSGEVIAGSFSANGDDLLIAVGAVHMSQAKKKK